MPFILWLRRQRQVNLFVWGQHEPRPATVTKWGCLKKKKSEHSTQPWRMSTEVKTKRKKATPMLNKAGWPSMRVGSQQVAGPEPNIFPLCDLSPLWLPSGLGRNPLASPTQKLRMSSDSTRGLRQGVPAFLKHAYLHISTSELKNVLVCDFILRLFYKKFHETVTTPEHDIWGHLSFICISRIFLFFLKWTFLRFVYFMYLSTL